MLTVKIARMLLLAGAVLGAGGVDMPLVDIPLAHADETLPKPRLRPRRKVPIAPQPAPTPPPVRKLAPTPTPAPVRKLAPPPVRKLAPKAAPRLVPAPPAMPRPGPTAQPKPAPAPPPPRPAAPPAPWRRTTDTGSVGEGAWASTITRPRTWRAKDAEPAVAPPREPRPNRRAQPESMAPRLPRGVVRPAPSAAPVPSRPPPPTMTYAPPRPPPPAMPYPPPRPLPPALTPALTETLDLERDAAIPTPVARPRWSSYLSLDIEGERAKPATATTPARAAKPEAWRATRDAASTRDLTWASGIAGGPAGAASGSSGSAVPGTPPGRRVWSPPVDNTVPPPPPPPAQSGR